MFFYSHFDLVSTLMGLYIKVLFRCFDLSCWRILHWFSYNLELLLLTNLKISHVAWGLIWATSYWRFLSRGLICCKDQVSRLEHWFLKLWHGLLHAIICIDRLTLIFILQPFCWVPLLCYNPLILHHRSGGGLCRQIYLVLLQDGHISGVHKRLRKVWTCDHVRVMALGNMLSTGRGVLLFLNATDCWMVFWLLFVLLPFRLFVVPTAVFLTICINFIRFWSKIDFIFVNY